MALFLARVKEIKVEYSMLPVHEYPNIHSVCVYMRFCGLATIRSNDKATRLCKPDLVSLYSVDDVMMLFDVDFSQ